MKTIVQRLLTGAAVAALLTSSAQAATYHDAVELFRHAGQSSEYFSHSYAYAVFPNVGKAGLVIGGAHGTGHVYVGGVPVGTVTLNQLSIGAQAGGQDYAEMIFFEDKRALEDFTSGHFEFGADANVVVITAAANATATTGGANAGASGGDKNAVAFGGFHNGMAVFTIVKGGLMYGATIAGQKFSYEKGLKD